MRGIGGCLYRVQQSRLTLLDVTIVFYAIRNTLVLCPKQNTLLLIYYFDIEHSEGGLRYLQHVVLNDTKIPKQLFIYA
jgi:hypothetical protein